MKYIDRLKEIISEELDTSISEIELTDDLETNLGADSLGVVEIVIAVESAFWITISDEEARTIRTVQDLANLIELKV